MENKKLLKFLLKDIAEIEELFAEKGSDGFDAYEINFLQTRFKGARQIIQILSEKEELGVVHEAPVIEEKPIEIPVQSELVAEEIAVPESDLEEEEPEQEFNEDIAEGKSEDEAVSENEQEEIAEEQEEVDSRSTEENTEEEHQPEAKEEEPEKIADSTNDMELDEEQEILVNRTLGDSFLKEKSVNDLMSNGTGKLENKLSNSPVNSIQRSIGINDRYQYIRELFDGSAETFSKTVSELDRLNSIQEAVAYLQQNYKWKKTETSLKFVNLVKRRFPNG